MNKSEIDYLRYEIREIKSEIARHHKLILKLREGLTWALDQIPEEYTDLAAVNKISELKTFLNREVGD